MTSVNSRRVKQAYSKTCDLKRQINSRVENSGHYWSGDAHNAFRECWQECNREIERGNKLLNTIGNKLDSLQSSVNRAEADKERKRLEGRK